MDDLIQIKKYILFLKEKQNLSVSLHTKEFNTVINSSVLSPFNIHDNSYCTYIKTIPEAKTHCINCQTKIIKKIKNGSFCGTCYAGVKEYVYPIIKNDNCIGFISVSGYKTENCESYQKEISKKYHFNYKELKNVYCTLKEYNNDKELVDTLICPLCAMLELAINKTDDKAQTDTSLPEKIEQYIRQNRNQNITSKSICEEFACSRSYMSTQFNKKYKKTIREYITELRLEDAKSLLKHSELNITEVAFSVGFTDANYFSNIFKKTFNIPPTKYRKKSRN